MSAISNFQYVTLVTQGGTPVRLADQYGANLPTTGSGSLVFSNGAVLTNVTITGTVNPFPLGAPNGTVGAPSIYFGTPDRGIFSQGASDISFAANGSLLASIEQNASIFHFQTNALQINLFSDTAGEVAIQGSDPSAGTHNLALNKYGANISIGEAAAPVAGGTTTTGILTFTSDAVALTVGSGAPTLSARSGSLYLRDDATSQPPYFNSGVGVTTTWQQFVGLTAAQTLTNKTLTSPVINNPTFTGTFTVNGQIVNNEGTITSSTPAQFIQTWNNAAVAFTGLQISIVNTASGSPSYPLQALVGGVNVFSVDKFGQTSNPGNAFHGGSVFIDNGTAIPAGGTQDIGALFSSTPHFGIIFGSGAPTASQAQGSLYLRSDGLPYYNTNGTTGWDRLVGLASSNTYTGANDFSGAASMLVPTAAANTNTTAAASTAYVVAALANLKINVQVFTSSGTYTPTANMVYCIIECWGAGGGGGGTAGTGGGVVAFGAGGGAGSYSRKFATASTIGGSQVVTIGAAGTGATAGNNAGGSGGDTSLGALCIGKGGSGGAGNAATSGAISLGGSGGIAGTGDLTSTGAPGTSTQAGSTNGIVGGAGGSSLVGGGGLALVLGANTATTGNAGTGHASGGGGGGSAATAGAAAGGVATAGYIVVTEFLLH
jgi:hypothetical protein